MGFVVLILLGFLGGIPAGMGMGGGTVTIPLLTLVGGVEQKIAQSANLFSFLPSGGASLLIHRKQQDIPGSDGGTIHQLPRTLF